MIDHKTQGHIAPASFCTFERSSAGRDLLRKFLRISVYQLPMRRNLFGYIVTSLMVLWLGFGIFFSQVGSLLIKH
jgi:hypothetical protein